MKIISAIFPICISIFGGIFFGLSSCGGYAWWKTFYEILFMCSLIPFFAFGAMRLKSEYSRKRLLKFLYTVTGILLISLLGFETAQASAAQFYPNAPANFYEWFDGFRAQLFGPPC